jgi:large subunit ribosomal protein L22
MATTELKGTKAQAKWVRTSARKARLVLDTIRGRSVPEARTVLAFSERAVARDIELVLRSAVANVESANEARVSGDDLVIAAAYANEGPTLKRGKPRARGRFNRIFKRTCHITVELAPAAQARLTTEPQTQVPDAGDVQTPKRARTAKPKTETSSETPAKPRTRGTNAGASAPAKPKRATRKKEA